MRNRRISRFSFGQKSSGLMAVLFLAGWQTACGASSDHNRHEYGEAAIFAGIAMTAGFIQAARSDQFVPVNAKPSSGCCAFCDMCSVPCSDSCVPIGTVCIKPRGCACYGTHTPDGDRSPTRPDSCGQLYVSPDGATTNYPIIISP